jgi:hypothetical protein
MIFLILVFSVGLASQAATIPERAALTGGKPLDIEEVIDPRPVPLARLAAAEIGRCGKAIPPIIVTIYGGELLVDGTPVRVTASSLTKWDDHADLLLFLGRSQNDPSKFRLSEGAQAFSKSIRCSE